MPLMSHGINFNVHYHPFILYIWADGDPQSLCAMFAKLLQLCLTLCDPMEYILPDSSVHGIPQARIGVGCPALLQGIFLIQELNPHLLHLLHWQAGSLQPVPPGKPNLNSINGICDNQLPMVLKDPCLFLIVKPSYISFHIFTKAGRYGQ